MDIRPGKESPNNEEEYVHHWPSTRKLGVGLDKASEGYMSLSWNDAQSYQESTHHRLASGGGSHTTGRSRDIHRHDPEDAEGHHRDLSPLDDDLQLRTAYPVPQRGITSYSPIPNEQHRDPFADAIRSSAVSSLASSTIGETEKTGKTGMMGRSTHTHWVSDVVVTSPGGMQEVSNLPASTRREGR